MIKYGFHLDTLHSSPVLFLDQPFGIPYVCLSVSHTPRCGHFNIWPTYVVEWAFLGRFYSASTLLSIYVCPQRVLGISLANNQIECSQDLGILQSPRHEVSTSKHVGLRVSSVFVRNIYNGRMGECLVLLRLNFKVYHYIESLYKPL